MLLRSFTVVASTAFAALAFTSSPAIADDTPEVTYGDELAGLVPVDPTAARTAVQQTDSGVRAAAQLGLTKLVDGANTFHTPAGLGALAGDELSGSSTLVLITNAPDQQVTVTNSFGVTVGIGLPTAAGGQDVQIVNGSAVFADPDNGTTTTVQPLADGSVRSSVSIAGPGSPTTYRFPLTLPPGGRAALQPDGSVVISSGSSEDAGAGTGGDSAITSLAPPWAIDAAGTPVPTSYSLDGEVLVQHVAFTEANIFPIVADPWWQPSWAGTLWQVAKCAGSISVALGSLAIPVSKLRLLVSFTRSVGGVGTAARLLIGATSLAEKRQLLVGAIGTGAVEILGIDQIRANC